MAETMSATARGETDPYGSLASGYIVRRFIHRPADSRGSVGIGEASTWEALLGAWGCECCSSPLYAHRHFYLQPQSLPF